MKTDEKSILLISHEISNTGAPILCRRISEQLKANGYKTVFISLCNGIVTDKIRNAADEVKVVNIRNSLVKKVLRLINPKWGKQKSLRLELLLKHYRRKGYGKVIVNSMESGSVVPSLKKNGYKIVTLVHEMSSVYEKFNNYYKIDNIVEYSDYIVFPSKYVKKEFLENATKKVQAKIELFPQGCYKEATEIKDKNIARQSIADNLGLPADSKFLVCSGAFDMIKGTDFVPLIIDRLKDYRDLYILWLGEIKKTPYSVSVISQIKRMGLENKIQFLGFIDNAEKYNDILCGSEAFLLTSREDPMPSVMAEAISMKLPVVAFKGSGGAEELLSEDRGLLAKYCDIDDYCSKIRLILDNEVDVNAINERAYDYLKENLVFEDYVNKLENLLM